MSASIIRTTGATNVLTSATVVSWQYETYFEKSWFSSANPSRITVPTGVTECEIIFFTSDPAAIMGSLTDIDVTIRKNGATFFIFRAQDRQYSTVSVSTGLIQVVAGDYFELVMTASAVPCLVAGLFSQVCVVEPEDRRGFVAAALASNTTMGGFSSPTTLSFTTPSYDDLATHNGTTGFVVPQNVVLAVVSLSTAYSSGTGTSDTRYDLLINGVVVSSYQDNSGDEYVSPPCFGGFQVQTGDVITVRASTQAASSVLLASRTVIHIEWFYPEPTDPGIVSQKELLHAVIGIPPSGLGVGDQKVHAVLGITPSGVGVGDQRVHVIIFP